MDALSIVTWVAYAAFATGAVALGADDRLLQLGPLWGGKLAIWIALATFLAYSLYSSTRENLLRTIGVLGRLWWGRQIMTDLYLGLMLSLGVICLHEGALVALVWLAPLLVFANLATLLYFAIHYDAIVARFL